MTEVININAKLFNIITKTDATEGNAQAHIQTVLGRVKDKAGKKVCITLSDGNTVWFDDQGQPTTPEKRKYPSLAKQAMNVSAAALKAFNEFGKDVDNGGGKVLASPEEKQRRLDICGTCELFDATKGRCTECGCHTPWKVSVQSATCPHPDGDKWLIKEATNE